MRLERSVLAEVKPPLAVAVKAKARQEADDVIDLLSSDDEAEAPDEEDEAATLHGEISPVSHACQISASSKSNFLCIDQMKGTHLALLADHGTCMYKRLHHYLSSLQMPSSMILCGDGKQKLFWKLRGGKRHNSFAWGTAF